ncbi:hypothetical protein EX30DRAFT_395754 [Ascodesmis nigricans]|uniref:Uncharacterized protein n=1 Tax=Ascodesmis nigricans TaxID=341454 RepID=A0A4S2MX48_9PEZI|nr:hypothetical protein EX30DRAFT_395754 [Ascodesmis nigricans]
MSVSTIQPTPANTVSPNTEDPAPTATTEQISYVFHNADRTFTDEEIKARTHDIECPANFFRCDNVNTFNKGDVCKLWSMKIGYINEQQKGLGRKCCPSGYECGSTFESFCIPIGQSYNGVSGETSRLFVEPQYITVSKSSTTDSERNLKSTCTDSGLDTETTALIIIASFIGGALLVGLALWVMKRYIGFPCITSSRRSRSSGTTSRRSYRTGSGDVDLEKSLLARMDCKKGQSRPAPYPRGISGMLGEYYWNHGNEFRNDSNTRGITLSPPPLPPVRLKVPWMTNPVGGDYGEDGRHKDRRDSQAGKSVKRGKMRASLPRLKLWLGDSVSVTVPAAGSEPILDDSRLYPTSPKSMGKRILRISQLPETKYDRRQPDTSARFEFSQFIRPRSDFVVYKDLPACPAPSVTGSTAFNTTSSINTHALMPMQDPPPTPYRYTVGMIPVDMVPPSASSNSFNTGSTSPPQTASSALFPSPSPKTILSVRPGQFPMPPGMTCPFALETSEAHESTRSPILSPTIISLIVGHDSPIQRELNVILHQPLHKHKRSLSTTASFRTDPNFSPITDNVSHSSLLSFPFGHGRRPSSGVLPKDILRHKRSETQNSLLHLELTISGLSPSLLSPHSNVSSPLSALPPPISKTRNATPRKPIPRISSPAGDRTRSWWLTLPDLLAPSLSWSTLRSGSREVSTPSSSDSRSGDSSDGDAVTSLSVPLPLHTNTPWRHSVGSVQSAVSFSENLNTSNERKGKHRRVLTLESAGSWAVKTRNRLHATIRDHRYDGRMSGYGMPLEERVEDGEGAWWGSLAAVVEGRGWDIEEGVKPDWRSSWSAEVGNVGEGEMRLSIGDVFGAHII